jgi:hypothetical protein
MSSPKKRSMSSLKTISPNKCTNTRKPVVVQAGVIVDGEIAVIKPFVEGRPDLEPFTNPGRVAVLNGMGADAVPNALVNAGFFMTASAVLNSTTDAPLRTSRGYDFKLFLVSVPDMDLLEDDASALKRIGQIFCDVSTYTNPDVCTNSYFISLFL